MVITDKSQGGVAPSLRCDGSFDYCFIANLLISYLSKNSYTGNWSTFGTVTGKKVYCLKLKDKLSRDLTYLPSMPLLGWRQEGHLAGKN